MKNHHDQSELLMTALQLAQKPVAMAFCDEVPSGVASWDGVAPAGCSFWQEGAARTFATSVQDHQLCAIGIHTHHMSPVSPGYEADLQETLQAMSGLDYVRTEEVAAIPVVKQAVKHVVYGPLENFPAEPAVVLLFAHARQGLVLSEALTRVDDGIPLAMGRPACAVVPQVLNSGNAAMSLGCCGARAYLDTLPDSAAMWALPGDKLSQYCEQIKIFARANESLKAFHDRRRSDVASGDRPTVLQSLQRIS